MYFSRPKIIPRAPYYPKLNTAEKEIGPEEVTWNNPLSFVYGAGL